MSADEEATGRAAKMEAWLRERWIEADCPVCRATGWDIEGPIRLADTEAITRAVIAKDEAPFSSYPLMMVTCRDCGHVLWFNAIKAGLA